MNQSLKEYIGPVTRKSLESRLEDHYKEPIVVYAKYDIESDETLVTLWFMRSDKTVLFNLSSLGFPLGYSMEKAVEEGLLVEKIVKTLETHGQNN